MDSFAQVMKRPQTKSLQQSKAAACPSSYSRVAATKPFLLETYDALSHKSRFTIADIKTFLCQKFGMDLDRDWTAVKTILNRSVRDGLLIRNGEGGYKVAAPRRRKKSSKGGSKKRRSRKRRSAKKSRGKRRSKRGASKSRKSGGGKRRSRRRRKKAANPEEE